jgi:putative salt-induced outer membrane protein
MLSQVDVRRIVNKGLFRVGGLLVWAVLGSAAMAQVKTDGQWRGLAGASLSATSGNTEGLALLLNADMARATEQDKITLGGRVNYAKNKNVATGVSETTANNWGANGQYDYNLSPQIYVFGKLFLEGDQIVDLKLRAALTGGAGYHVIVTHETTFDVFGGVGYIADEYSVAKTIGDETDTRFDRATLLLGEESSHQLSQTTTFKQRLEVYPGVSGDKAVLVKFNAGLGVAMSSTLSLTVGVTDSYNSKPPVGVKSNDFGLFTGINVKLGAL